MHFLTYLKNEQLVHQYANYNDAHISGFTGASSADEEKQLLQVCGFTLVNENTSHASPGRCYASRELIVCTNARMGWFTEPLQTETCSVVKFISDCLKQAFKKKNYNSGDIFFLHCGIKLTHNRCDCEAHIWVTLIKMSENKRSVAGMNFKANVRHLSPPLTLTPSSSLPLYATMVTSVSQFLVWPCRQTARQHWKVSAQTALTSSLAPLPLACLWNSWGLQLPPHSCDRTKRPFSLRQIRW